MSKHQTVTASGDGPAVTVMATAHTVTASVAARTIEGTVTFMERVSDDLRLKWAAGSLTPREPIKRVKLLVDHDTAQPVGYMTEYRAGAGNSLWAKFYVPEGAAGDAALADAAHGRRDGFSVGVTAVDCELDKDGVLVVTRGTIHEVSLCAVPAFQDAQVENVAAALAARAKEKDTMGDIQKESTAEGVAVAATTASKAPATPAGVATPAAASPEQAAPTVAAAAAPVLLAGGERQGPAPALDIKDRPLSLRQVAAKVAEAVATDNPSAVHAALADVTPSSDGGKGWLRDGWMGELWTAARTDRPWIEAFGPTEQLTSMKLKGWRWGVRPTVAKYSGNKTEVPTNSPTTVPYEATAGRWAGGWDIDRIFLDLGEAGFLESFWQAAMAEYKRESDLDIAAQIIAAATVGGAAASTLGAIKAGARALRSVGANAGVIKLGLGAFDQYSDLTQSEVPHWLANVVGGVNVAEESAVVGNLTIQAAPELDDLDVLVADRRAVTVREKTPIRVQAFDVARGGVDLGFYSYGGLVVNDPRAVQLYTVGAGE